MELIINDFMKNFIQKLEKLTKGLLEQDIDLGTFANNIKEKTDELGRNILKETLEAMDETLVKSSNRKKK